MSTVSIDKMRPKLLSLEHVTQQLQKTEPLGKYHVSADAKVKFKLNPDWGVDLDAVGPLQTVGAEVTIDGNEYPLTKGAVLQAFANLGLTEPYVKKTPASLTEPLLNYGYGNSLGDRAYNALSVAGKIVSFAKPTIHPFSNLQLLEQVVEGVQDFFGGPGTEILVDYKFRNDLKKTDIRLIIPEAQQVIEGGDMHDVEDDTDLWSAGVHLSNSLTGRAQTSVEAYLFRWWCTNGATTELATSNGIWSRKSQGQEDDVYLWAKETVNGIFEGISDRWDSVQALTDLKLGGNSADVLRQIFEDYKIPVAQRRSITDKFANSMVPSTMYGVMNVITESANEEGVTPDRRDMLMRIGGDVPSAVFDTVKAQVWREGHLADPDAPNPYEIQRAEAQAAAAGAIA